MTSMNQRPRLDRRIYFDDRSWNYPVRRLIGEVQRKTTLWEIPGYVPLNQGSEGACVGFGWSHQLAVGPILNPASQTYAQEYYRACQQEDRMQGRFFAEGATVLAGAEVARKRGLIRGYSWAFGINDVIDTLCAKGPVVLGLPWYEGMYETDHEGKVVVNGPLVGGHCILATGYIANHPKWGGNWIRWTNSWGRNYGQMGNGFIRDRLLQSLLEQSGEGCIADEINPAAPKPVKPWWYRFFGW